MGIFMSIGKRREKSKIGEFPSVLISGTIPVRGSCPKNSASPVRISIGRRQLDSHSASP